MISMPILTNIELVQQKDIPSLQEMYHQAIHYQRKISKNSWLDFREDDLKREIERGEIYKIILNNSIIGIFNLIWNDQAIWGEKESGNALYIHRIVSSRSKSLKIFPTILDWCISKAKSNGKENIRMDTWHDNTSLIQYYQSFGFCHLGNFKAAHPDRLPANYSSTHLAFLEYTISE